MFFVFAAHLLSIMNNSAIKILLPDIMMDLGAEINVLTWVVTAFTLPFAILTPICGQLGDKFGSRRFFTLGVLVFAVGSFMCGLSSTFGFLIIGRLIQGVGSGLLAPNSLVLILSKTPDNQTGKMLGIWGAIGASGAVIGPVISGMLLSFFSWKSLFFLIGALLTVIVLVMCRELFSAREDHTLAAQPSFDYSGALFLMSASILLLIGITFLPDLGWRDLSVQLLLGSSVVMFIIFFQVERLSSHPMIDLKMFRIPRFSLGLLVGFTEQFVVAGTLFIMPIFFATVKGFNPLQISLLLAPVAVSVALISPVGGRMADRKGFGLPISTGMIMRSVSFFLLSLITIHTSYIFIAIFLVINGIGFGLTTVPSLNSVLSTFPHEEHGLAAGFHNMVRMTGSSLGTAVSGIVLYALIPSSFEGLTGFISGFQQVFLMCSLFCVPGFFAGIKLIKERKLNRVVRRDGSSVPPR